MKAKTFITLIATHLFVGAIGFAAGIYFLPIITAPASPTGAEISALSAKAQYSAEFKRDLKDSDALHWGEGQLTVGSEFITLMGELAPGPDYRLYLSSTFVETEADFNRLKPAMVQVGDVKTFENFVVKVSPDIDPSQYNTVVVWCETFGEFITSAKYR
ncbi:DM13 domain-containing protein [Thalassomonas viridans]|uniref:DM13 domain-containing protein n=1 Tax=Thalassomonas viridans TaxID=137584 RepID=A0AAE9ZB50_9GAMM|nr:DM13 domain-containing protein [Thalassomonas viridans]WDE09292.1 DM13 domain-containing protein [Thalassomonas viridans]